MQTIVFLAFLVAVDNDMLTWAHIHFWQLPSLADLVFSANLVVAKVFYDCCICHGEVQFYP